MKSYLKSGLWAVAISALAGCAQQDNLKIYMIGDSTMAEYEENTTQIRGWGEVVGQIVPKGVSIRNYARPGRSSRSFYDEGSWAKVRDTLAVGDYVLIQFAHNDEKEKGLDGADGRGTAPWTTYREYLRKYVTETRERGAKPILVQPIVRRYFEGNSLSARAKHNLSADASDTTLSYTAAMLSVAKEMNVPIVNLCSKTQDIVEAYGPTASKNSLFVMADNTHTTIQGATIFAMAAAEAMDTMSIWKGDLVKKDIIANPSEFDFGEVFVGDTASQCIDLVDLSGVSTIQPRYLTRDGMFEIKANGCYKLSQTMSGPKKDTLMISSHGSTNFFVHIAPNSTKSCNGKITIKCNGNTASVKLTGTGKASNGLEPLSATMPDINRSMDSKDLIAKLSMLKNTKKTPEGIDIEGGVWPAEIDESGERFVQIRISAKDRDVLINKIKLDTPGYLCYRAYYSFGNDFYQRTVIGERQTTPEGVSTDEYATRIRIKAGSTVLIRLFPWSKEESSTKKFSIANLAVEGMAWK